MASGLKPPLHRAATFEPPLSDQNIDQDAQRSPKPRKFCFCVTAAARPLCVHWTIKTAEASHKLVHNVYNCTNYFTGPPMADPCESILRPRRCACLPPASFERPVSDRPPRRPPCDCFEHAQNFTATMASTARSERPLWHPWTTKATLEQLEQRRQAMLQLHLSDQLLHCLQRCVLY